VANGTFFDLVELDAASNNGVDAMRELIQSVHLGLGASSRRKVYIIDEVHMLSPAASNTLLKTLEEPPAHVVFVLATTDPQKVLPTIRSRTQHFEFTLLSHGQLVDHLHDILAREGLEVDAEAVDLIAGRAAGSVRDALSLLDQALAVGAGRLDAERVQSAFGGAPFELRLGVLKAAAEDDVATALVAVHDLVASGHDVRRIADDLLRTLRDAFLQANASGRVPYDGPPEECERLTELAKEMGNPAVVRAIEIFGEAIVDIRGQAVADPRLVLEVAVVRIARRESRTRVETLLDRVERLEQRLADGGGASPSPSSASTAPATRPAPAPGGPVLARRDRAPKAAPENPPPAPEAAASAEPLAAASDAMTAATAFALDDVVEAWPDVLNGLKAPVRTGIQDAQPIALEGGVIVFGVPKVRLDAINERFRKEAAAIKDAFSARLGTSPRFQLRAHDFNRVDAFRPAAVADDPAPVVNEPEPPADDEEAVDLTELSDAPDAPQPEAVTKLVADLGAEVIDERRRG
jgi:DNA polymerase-3 subunit gamma/tau